MYLNQSTFGYILYLLLKYGNEERSANFYAKKLNQAFPNLKANFDSSWSTPEEQLKSCLNIRCFERLLEWFDFISVRKIRGQIGLDDTFIKNKLLDKILKIDKTKFVLNKVNSTHNTR